MSEDVLDAIVVGAGSAGTIAAYTLAKAGKSVIVVERGISRLQEHNRGSYLYALSAKIFPDFEKTSPLERKILHEKISLMTPESNFTIDYTSPDLGEEGAEAYSVLHAQFGPWLAEQAEHEGAEFIYGIRVDDLIVRDGKVCGIKAGEDEIEAQVVILADGCNSLLAQKIGLVAEPHLNQMAVCCKELIELPSATIEDRFNLKPDEGAAWLFAGDSTHGRIGGGFLYTNKNSVSLGVVATISDLIEGHVPIYQMMEDFKNHPAVEPLVKGGKMIEYSGHLVPEGGYKMIPKIVGDGVLVTGDAAMLCINLGYSVRGIDFAIASGEMAGLAAIEALDKVDVSETGLRNYLDKLENSFVLQDLKRFQRFPHFMESTKRIFNEYPQMVREMMDALFIVDGNPVQPIKRKMMPSLKKVGLGNIVKDVMGGLKAL